MSDAQKLGLRVVEHAALLRQLETRRRLLFSTDGDGPLLEELLRKLAAGEAEVTQAEVLCMLLHVRAQRQRIADEMAALEARRRTTVDTAIDGAWRVLDAEAMLLDDVLRRLWTMAR